MLQTVCSTEELLQLPLEKITKQRLEKQTVHPTAPETITPMLLEDGNKSKSVPNQKSQARLSGTQATGHCALNAYFITQMSFRIHLMAVQALQTVGLRLSTLKYY